MLKKKMGETITISMFFGMVFLWYLMRSILVVEAGIYAFIIPIGVFTILILITLLLGRKQVVHTWYKKGFKNGIWYWVWGLVIELVIIGFAFLAAWGLDALIDYLGGVIC